jgi:hypothetical protein
MRQPEPVPAEVMTEERYFGAVRRYVAEFGIVPSWIPLAAAIFDWYGIEVPDEAAPVDLARFQLRLHMLGEAPARGRPAAVGQPSSPELPQELGGTRYPSAGSLANLAFAAGS